MESCAMQTAAETYYARRDNSQFYRFISDRSPITKHANPQMATRMP